MKSCLNCYYGHIARNQNGGDPIRNDTKDGCPIYWSHCKFDWLEIWSKLPKALTKQINDKMELFIPIKFDANHPYTNCPCWKSKIAGRFPEPPPPPPVREIKEGVKIV